ncbi:hypothetical protein [Thiomicrorhabdus indica]|uniref:hypothetical protein n=1 Tax=Thiomicrorhabdus indica TaxID=2267253 RepID=UPI00102D7396|nr:hypothetical protein [Thiomicrorhabdus indica]
MKTFNVLGMMLLSHAIHAANFPAFIDTPTLLQWPNEVRACTADAYKYALVDRFQRNVEVNNSGIFDQKWHSCPAKVPKKGELCDAKQSRLLTPTMVTSICRPVSYKYVLNAHPCSDNERCIALEVHPEIEQDSELNTLLIESIRNPCKYIPNPDPADDFEQRHHWCGFARPNFHSWVVLNCHEKSPLPYNRAYIYYGDKEVEIQLNK